MKTLLALACVVLLSACGGSGDSSSPSAGSPEVPAPSGSPEVAAPADSAETSQPADAHADPDDASANDAADPDAADPNAADAAPDAGKLTPADAAPDGADPAEPATAAPKPSTDTTPAPAPERAPDLSCSEGSGCFVYFREQRCNYSEPIAIPVRQKRNARRLYPSSTADQPVACKPPEIDDEMKARERWSADCVKGSCTLIDSKPMGRGRR